MNIYYYNFNYFSLLKAQKLLEKSLILTISNNNIAFGFNFVIY